MTSTLIKALIVILILNLSGCGSRLLTVFKIDIQQGNAVEPEKVEQLEIGMNKEQVEFLMGTPLVTDPFHPDRWDYVYFLLPGHGEREKRHVILFFEGDQIKEIIKRELPEAVATEDVENAENQES